MGGRNTFVVLDCKRRQIIMVTRSARKAATALEKGVRVDVWDNNTRVDTIYNHSKRDGQPAMGPYIDKEREYIGRKQAEAERRNKRRRFFS